MLWIRQPNSAAKTPVPYDGEMPAWLFLRDVIAPEFGLDCNDGTVLAKVHTPELRVVFSNECRGKPLKTLVNDWSDLILSPWPKDSITIRSLVGNAQP